MLSCGHCRPHRSPSRPSLPGHRASAVIIFVGVVIGGCWATATSAQTASIVRAVNLRPTPSTQQPSLRLLTPSDQVTLLAAQPTNGFYHVRTADAQEGWVWSQNVRVSASAAVPATTAPSGGRPGPGVPGSSTAVGCGDGLWQHVYRPQRLLVKQDCITVTGVIVDATANQSTHQPDGVRHEADGDTHGWLKVDPQFASLLDAGNASDEGGNLVFELVCHYMVRQADAQPACAGFRDTTPIPPVGTHVAITGTYVEDTHHGHWNEIHPVSRITAQ